MLYSQPWMFIRQTDLDINSGDLRYEVRVCYVPIRREISESVLSREVRRLGIAIPTKRAWQPAFLQRREPRFVSYWYGTIVKGVFQELVEVFDQAHIPDKERTVILGNFMNSLRGDEPHVALNYGYVLIARIAAEHGVDAFVPDVVQQLKQSELWNR